MILKKVGKVLANKGKIDMSKCNIYSNTWTPIFEWYVVRCGSLRINIKQSCVLKKLDYVLKIC